MNSTPKRKLVSQEDAEAWQAATKDVKPLEKTHTVGPASPPLPKNLPAGDLHQQVWDLHGHSLSEAWSLTQNKIQHTPFKSLLFITGKSGDINREFQTWLEQNSRVSRVQPQPSGGAYRVFLRKLKK